MSYCAFKEQIKDRYCGIDTQYVVNNQVARIIRNYRVVKHDVYGKPQTAKIKHFAVSLQLCVQQSEIICICNE